MSKSREEIEKIIKQSLHQIAPEAELEELDPDANLQNELELDSMDFLRFMLSLNAALKIDVPEKDYRELATLNRCMDYICSKIKAE
jgi:acyl carrier protein